MAAILVKMVLPLPSSESSSSMAATERSPASGQATTVVKLKIAGMLCMENCGFSVEKVLCALGFSINRDRAISLHPLSFPTNYFAYLNMYVYVQALKNVKGVKDAEVDFDSRIAFVTLHGQGASEEVG